MKHAALVLVSLAMTSIVAAPAVAAPEKLRVGTPEAVGFNFYMLDAGIDLGVYRKLDLDIERIDVEGGAKLHQAMAAGSLDIALGGGTDLLFLAKGSPEKAVAVLGTAPANLSILVLGDSPIRSIADLKDKKIAATTVGSLTSWFAQEIARREGWGVDGVTLVYLGGNESMLAGLATKSVDAASASLEVGHIRGDAGRKYRMIVKGGEFVPDFVASVIYASDATIAARPDALRRFLKGWFETVAYLRGHKAQAIPLMAKIMAAPEDAVGRIYDDEIDSYPTDGHFDRRSLHIVEQALIDFHRIDKMPDDNALLTEAYLPPK
ncbi:MAG TPA: ABC transporter substrate-binding protein [Stellaceae bacterium]|jgi:ABC-type nitrate/sulfonate/bicarbonate transport system substrate-binding protein